MFKVIIDNQSNYKFLYQKIFNQILIEVAKMCNLNAPSEVNVIITNDQMMKELNFQYRGFNKPTDILSFPTDYQELFKVINYNILGDIYFSFEKIQSQAKLFNHSQKREWAYLFTHGLLHLLGYDHQTNIETEIMNNLTEDVMKKLKIRRD